MLRGDEDMVEAMIVDMMGQAIAGAVEEPKQAQLAISETSFEEGRGCFGNDESGEITEAVSFAPQDSESSEGDNIADDCGGDGRGMGSVEDMERDDVVGFFVEEF